MAIHSKPHPCFTLAGVRMTSWNKWQRLDSLGETSRGRQTTVKSAVSDLCCRRPSTVSDRFSVHRRFQIQIDLSRATICHARPATAISCTVGGCIQSAVSDHDPRSVRCETVLASVLSTARCENALSCKCAPIFY